MEEHVEPALIPSGCLYVGVNPSGGRKPFYYAVLNEGLEVVASKSAPAEEVLDFLGDKPAVLVGITSSQGLSSGHLEEADLRQEYDLSRKGRTWRSWRVAEFELRRRNIRLYKSPDSIDRAPAWMRVGFEFYRDLKGRGYRAWTAESEGPARFYLEVNPHAGYTTLLNHRPLAKNTFEGRMQRQLVLYLEGLDIPDPLLVLEEITRHHLLQGQMPLARLYRQEQLDALVAAYTAFLAGEKPDSVIQIGRADEGLITLPVSELEEYYP